MIIFQTLDGREIDLTDYGLTFVEESDYFTGFITKSYTFPFNAETDEELAIILGMVGLENTSSYKIKVEGYLIVDHDFYEAYININAVEGTKADIKLFYGKETLPVFDKKLSQLPFPIIDTGGSLVNYAVANIDKVYPEVSHAFPMFYRPELKNTSNYEKFQLYVNYFSNTYLSNSLIFEDSKPVPNNVNVMVPCTFVMEILKVGFSSDGLQVRGDFVNDALAQKLVVIPSNFFEFYSDLANRESFSFEFYNTQETINTKTINVYTKTITPSATGTYTVKYRLDFLSGIAEFFEFTIKYGAETLFRAKADNQNLFLDDILTLNIVDTQVFEDIVIELKITEQVNTIAKLNYFVFEKEGGNVNTYPTEFSVADYLPDMKFRTFFNKIKKWFNLDVTYLENVVVLNFLDTTVQNLSYVDHSDYEIPEPRRTLNKNNLFKMTYPDKKEVLVSKDGQVFNENEFLSSEIEQVEIDVQPIDVKANGDLVTGSYPEDAPDLLIGIYNGTVDGIPVLTDKINGEGLSLQEVYERYHSKWLSYRANAEEYKDTFYAPVSEIFNLKKGISKYNKRHLIKKLRKRRYSEALWRIDAEMESF